jgi:hypothetical protein
MVFRTAAASASHTFYTTGCVVVSHHTRGKWVVWVCNNSCIRDIVPHHTTATPTAFHNAGTVVVRSIVFVPSLHEVGYRALVLVGVHLVIRVTVKGLFEVPSHRAENRREWVFKDFLNHLCPIHHELVG